MYFDFDSKPLFDVYDWAHLFEKFDYRVVAQDYIADVYVSTIWTGLNWSWADQPVGIFETFVDSKSDRGFELDGQIYRYDNKGAAVRGHLFTCMIVSTRYVKQLLPGA